MKTATTLYFELTELIGHETKLNQKDCIALIESYASKKCREQRKACYDEAEKAYQLGNPFFRAIRNTPLVTETKTDNDE